TGNYEGTVNKLSNPGRNDTVTLTNGSAVVNDPSIVAADDGKMVTGVAGLPTPVYVGGVTVGASFHLDASADPNVVQDMNYTGLSGGGQIITLSKYGEVTAAQSPGPVPDIGRSSSTADTKGCPNGELRCATFWGYAHDSVEVVGFNSHG